MRKTSHKKKILKLKILLTKKIDLRQKRPQIIDAKFLLEAY